MEMLRDSDVEEATTYCNVTTKGRLLKVHITMDQMFTVFNTAKSGPRTLSVLKGLRTSGVQYEDVLQLCHACVRAVHEFNVERESVLAYLNLPEQKILRFHPPVTHLDVNKLFAFFLRLLRPVFSMLLRPMLQPLGICCDHWCTQMRCCR